MTNQPLNIWVGTGISDALADQWAAQGHIITRFMAPIHDAILPDIVVGERCWRANDELLKTTEAMMFKAARAEKRVRSPKAIKPRQSRKKAKEVSHASA